MTHVARTLYLALGDSITCGYSATQTTRTFVYQVMQHLQEHAITTETRMVAQHSWTSRQLWLAAQTLPPAVWQNAGVATILIGGNDLRRQYYSLFGHPAPLQVVTRAVEGFSASLQRLCQQTSERGIPHVFIGNIYNPFPNAPMVMHAIENLNAVIQTHANTYNFTLVDLYSAFDMHQRRFIHHYRTGRIEDMATPFRRPIHPNDEGHQIIAKQFIRHIVQSFAKM